MKRLLIALNLFFISFLLFGQSSSTSATGSLNAIQPLSITAIGGSLSFGNIVLTGSTNIYQITPAQGQQFRILGHPGRSASITFNQTSLNNSVWVGVNGGSLGTLTFVPVVVTSQNNSVTSGNFYSLITSGNLGILDILVGGSINVVFNQPPGDYIGTFTISVSY